MQTHQQPNIKRPSSKQAHEDLARARQYGDRLRTFLAASNTGAIGILLATAGSLVGKDIAPNWVTVPVSIFAGNLVLFGISLIIGEHRSLLRRRDRDAQSRMPIWKMAITWNIIVLLVFVAGIFSSVAAFRSIKVPKSGPEHTQAEQRQKESELHPATLPETATSVHAAPSPGPTETRAGASGQDRPTTPTPQRKGEESSPAQPK
jgi:hypothetical protein